MAWWRRRKKTTNPCAEVKSESISKDEVYRILMASAPQVRYGVYNQPVRPGMSVQNVYDELRHTWRIPANIEPYVGPQVKPFDYDSNYYQRRPLPKLVGPDYVLQTGDLLEFHCPMGNRSVNIMRQPEERPVTAEATMMGYVYGLRAYKIEPDVAAEFVNQKPAEPIWRLFGGWGQEWPKPYAQALCMENRYSRYGVSPQKLEGAPHHHPHRCGINMYKLMLLEPGEISARMSWREKTPTIVALTRAWGTIIEHKFGYRVEHAEVIALLRPYRSPKLVISGFESVPKLDSDKFHELVHEKRYEEELVEIPAEEA